METVSVTLESFDTPSFYSFDLLPLHLLPVPHYASEKRKIFKFSVRDCFRLLSQVVVCEEPCRETTHSFDMVCLSVSGAHPEQVILFMLFKS